MPVRSRSLVSLFTCLFGLLSLIAVNAQADQYFDFTRTDSTIPPQCANPQLKDFQENTRYFYYGVKGSRAKGFTHEYPITREAATYLWTVMQDTALTKSRMVPADVAKNPELLRDYNILRTVGLQMGFDFGSEGEVLETLALYDLQKTYPPSHYYFTGGIEYGDPGFQGVLGELDLVVARRSDCAVVAVGEAKLGVNQLGHAQQQMVRFHAFVTQKICTSASAAQTANAPICKITNVKVLR